MGNTGRIVLGPGDACAAGAPVAGFDLDGIHFEYVKPVDVLPPVLLDPILRG